MIFKVMGSFPPPPAGGESRRGAASKTLRVMKLTALLLFVAILHVSAHGLAQDRVTFSGSNVSLEKVFSAIKQQTSFLFLYNDALLENTRKVTINVKDASIEEVMRVCAKDQPFDYTIKGKTIFIINKEEKAVEKPAPKPTNPGKDVKGRVVNNNGEPVQGATIKVKETGVMIMADANGEFELTGLENNNTLIISSVGHETITIKFTGNNFLSVVLQKVIAALDETVVKGYYNTTKRLNTGNVTTVKGEDIQKQPVSDPILALEGRVPGLFISQASGIPGAYSNIQLRGQNFIPSRDQYVPTRNNPLFIIDGVPFNSASLTISGLAGGAVGNPDFGNNAGLSPFNNLNPADIESIEVLKDADATAIYGSRGANGVILITTRKGKSGKTQFDFDASSGFGKVVHMIPMMNTEQYLTMRSEAFANDGKTPGASDIDLNGTWDASSYTNWQKILIGGTAHFTNIQGSVTGGNVNTQFFINGGFSKQTTVYPGNYYDKKAFLNFNINHTSSNKKFHALFSGGYVKDHNELPAADLASSINIAPNAPDLIDANGNLNWNVPFSNPFIFFKRPAMAVTGNLISNLNLDYTIIPGLQAKTSLGYTHSTLNQTNIIPASSYKPPNNVNPANRFNDWGTNDIETWIIEPQLNYIKNISKGKLDVLVGSTFQENVQNIVAQHATGFSSDDLIKNIAFATTITVLKNTNVKYHYSAIYGRINYNWQDKYLVNMTVRRDGSSRFGPGKQFGNFGAIGAGWIFSQETFIKNRLTFLSFGKLRGSYGITGNDQIPDYKYLSTYQGYTNSNYQGVLGLYPTQIANPYYAWETVKKLEAGIELGFLHDRILVNASYYRNRTNDQLVGYALPSTDGFTTIYSNLPAVVQNTGMEIAVNAINIRKWNLTWNSSFNISIPRNKLVSYPGLASSPYATTYKEGQSLFIKYLYHSMGVDQQTGVYMIEDIDKSNTITSNDKQLLKQVAQDYYGGIQNSISYNGFQLDILFQFVKQTGYNYSNKFTLPGFFNSGNSNQPTYELNRWQKIDDNTTTQKYTQQAGAALTAFSNAIINGDAPITDASFVRLKNISLSYQLPSKWIERVQLSNFRLYIQAQNLLTITNYQGMDPETQGLALPPLRMIVFGIHTSL